MACFYDNFYVKKNYAGEVEFIRQFVDNDASILDAGCGTGNHAKILQDLGYKISGFDISPDMVNIAREKVNGDFFVSDLLNVKLDKKFDLIISFFAVFNHLKGYSQFKHALQNLKNCLKDNGKIIIDLHNPQRSGKKIEKLDNATRIMSWRKCSVLGREFSRITYVVSDKKLVAHHVFRIFKMEKLAKIARTISFKNVEFYENYSLETKASSYSKNIQMVLS